MLIIRIDVVFSVIYIRHGLRRKTIILIGLMAWHVSVIKVRIFLVIIMGGQGSQVVSDGRVILKAYLALSDKAISSGVRDLTSVLYMITPLESRIVAAITGPISIAVPRSRPSCTLVSGKLTDVSRYFTHSYRACSATVDISA
jgi:hypothetical protein